MATTQHYLWAAGHFILLVAALRSFITFPPWKAISPFWYKTAYSGALVSYAIVCQKSLGAPQPSLAWFKRAMMDENIQYFLLAFFWFTSKPITMTLVPFAIFSLFHALTFTRTTLMSQFLPPGPPATANGPPTAHPYAKKLQVWVKANYDSAMRIVALAEIAIFVRVLLGAVIFWNSLLSPIVFAHFLRQRYYQSTFTRQAFGMTDARIALFVAQQGNPTLSMVYAQGKSLLTRWTGNTIAPQAAAQ